MIVPVLAIPWLTWNLVAAGYLKLVLTDAAIEGARYAALADQTPETARARALRLVTQATGGLATANAASSRFIDATGVATFEMQLMSIQPFQILAKARAVAERQ
jgi:hypothetical protein